MIQDAPNGQTQYLVDGELVAAREPIRWEWEQWGVEYPGSGDRWHKKTSTFKPDTSNTVHIRNLIPLYDHAAPCARCKEIETVAWMYPDSDERLKGQVFTNGARDGDIALVRRSDYEAKITEQADRIKALEALSVTNILIGVVPGDGDGFEVYAKSVQDVETAMSKLSEKAEEWDMVQPRLKALEAEVEQWKIHAKEILSGEFDKVIHGLDLQATIERQRKVIELTKTALEETKAAETFCRQYSHLPEATDDIADALESAERKRESALADIAELEKGVG